MTTVSATADLGLREVRSINSGDARWFPILGAVDKFLGGNVGGRGRSSAALGYAAHRSVTTLSHPTRISREEIREWAYDPDPALPENADVNVWDLMLVEWYPDVGLYLDLAADTRCPKRRYFLGLLRQGLRRKCARTTWLSKGADGVLSGFSRSHSGIAKRKGRGKKEKDRLLERLTESVHAESAAKGLEYARELLRLLETVHGHHSELVSFSKKLEAFVAAPATITDEYWARISDSEGDARIERLDR